MKEKLLSADHVMSLFGITEPVSDCTVPTSVIVGAPDNGRDVLREHAEETWPAANGHKADCCGYYEVNECECQRAGWKPLSAGNYPTEPNLPRLEIDPRDRL